MELLLQYCWRHRLYPDAALVTTEMQPVEVLDPGLQNRHAGPDFFNAKLKIDGTLWVGNVEIHDKASDWYLHGHDHDAAYDNVVLHVVGKDDTRVTTHQGRLLPQMVMAVPTHVTEHYGQLLHADRYPPCYRLIPSLTRLLIHSWLSALDTERLEQKTEDIRTRVKRCNGSWEAAYLVTLARSFGFGENGDAFEAWAMSLPQMALEHHRDDEFQIEAMMMGQAGLLAPEALSDKHREAALEEGYFTRLRNEYLFLAHKFSLTPIHHKMWKFLRMHPQNFPTVRLSQLVKLFCSRQAGLSQLVACQTVEDLHRLFTIGVTPYWETHYTFGAVSNRNQKRISKLTRQVLIINTAIPMLFAYGRHLGDDRLCDRAFDLLEQLPAENNHIVRMWDECGLHVDSAADSQALIQLKKMYCDRKDCLRCRIGFEYLKREKPTETD